MQPTYQPARAWFMTAMLFLLVAINFSARPIGEKITSARSGTATRQTPVVPFYNKVSVRIADPTDPNVNPLCMQ